MARSAKKTGSRVIPISKPFLGREEARAAQTAILSGWVTQGPRVQEFENKFAAYVGAKHACAVSNCTTALHLSLLAAGVQPGNVVITVSHSFIATANAVRHCFAEPVFIDIDPDTYNMSPQRLEECLQKECELRNGKLFYKYTQDLIYGESPMKFSAAGALASQNWGRIAAIIVVHQIGIPADLKTILPIARKYSLPVIEDAACAVGSAVSMDNGKTFEKIGKPHGDIACFSFHPRKVLTTGDGGMITTNNKMFNERMRLLRHQGMSVSDRVRHTARTIIIEEYATTAYNYRLTDIQAAIGIEQLRKMPAMMAKRRKIAAYYIKELKKIGWLKPFAEKDYQRTNWQSFPVRLADNAPVNRDDLMQHLLDHGIATRPGVMNSHQEAPYRPKIWRLPESEKSRNMTVLLPIYHSLSMGDCARIIKILKLIKI